MLLSYKTKLYELVSVFLFNSMNFKLLFAIWIIIGRQKTQASEYQVFVSSSLVYYVINNDECNKLNGNKSTVGEVDYFIRNSFIKTDFGVEESQYICQVHGIQILERNILKLPDDSYCYFDKGYCYHNNHTLIVWDRTLKFEPLVLFEGNLRSHAFKPFSDVWFTVLSHKNINLRLVSFEGNFLDNFDETKSYSTFIEGVYIKSIKLIGPNDYINKDYIEKYIGKLDDLKFPDSSITMMFHQKAYFKRLRVVSPTKKTYIQSKSKACKRSQRRMNERFLEANFPNQSIKSACLISSEFSIDNNIIYLPDQMCQFDKGYCYVDGKHIAVWNNTSYFDPLIVFERNFSIFHADFMNMDFSLILVHSEDPKMLLYTTIYANENNSWILTENTFSSFPDGRQFYLEESISDNSKSTNRSKIISPTLFWLILSTIFSKLAVIDIGY